jgi:hypothetical protein
MIRDHFRKGKEGYKNSLSHFVYFNKTHYVCASFMYSKVFKKAEAANDPGRSQLLIPSSASSFVSELLDTYGDDITVYIFSPAEYNIFIEEAAYNSRGLAFSRGLREK